MTGHGRHTSPRTARLALLLFVALLVTSAHAGVATAAPKAPAVCGPADCPAAGAPQVIALGSPASAAGARRGKARPSRLRVELVGGTGARRATVVSPTGRRWRIARSRTFKPKVLGRWTITGNRIAGKATVTFPQYRSTIVKVRRGGRGTARVRWVQQVSTRTKVARATAIQSSVKANGTYTVTLSDPTRRIAVGDTLTAGPGKATPRGLLIAVATVTRDGDRAVVTGTQAPLSAIGPQARVRVTPTLQVGPGKLGAKSSAAQQPEGGVEKPYKCEGGVDATIKGSLGLSAGADIGISWGGFWHPLTIKAIAAARLQQSSQLALRVAGKAKCELDVDLLKTPIRYSPLVFSVGPVPVVITPKLNFHVIAEGEVEGAVSTSVRQALDARVGLEWDGSKLIPIKSLDNDFRFTPLEPEFNAGIMAGIGPKLMFDVYEVGGPYLTAEGLMRLTVDSTRDPWWKLTGGFQAGAGIAFQVWRFSFDRNVPDLFSKEWTIAKASGSAPPQISTSSLPDATAARPYSATLAAIGGIRPFAWRVTKGSLPAGLTLNATSGQISGTPTATGTSAFTVTVTDAKRKSASRDLRIVVSNPPATVTTAALPNATAGKPYSTVLAGSGSAAPYRWAISAGSLPAGITLDGPSGTISGIPSGIGTSAFTVELTGADGQQATRALSIAVDAAALSVPAQTLPAATVESAYRATLTADGGVEPLRWAVTAGALPDGLSLSPEGVVSGSATAPGEAGFTVTVTDAVGTRATRELTIRSAYPAFSVPEQTLLDPMDGEAYSAQLRATGGGAPITWAVVDGALPDGLALAADGTISGTATVVGDAEFTVEATDKFGQRARRGFSVSVLPNALLIVTRSISAVIGQPLDVTLERRGGRGPFSWALADGSTLPTGLTLSPDGRLTGTPVAQSSTTVGVELVDADDVSVTATIAITVKWGAFMKSVSCVTDSFCVVTESGGGLSTWDGSDWSPWTRVTSSAAVVSCWAPGDCLTVTEYGGTVKQQRDGGAWSDLPALPAPVRFVRDVECVRADFCMASGTTNERAVVWTWDGSAWSTQIISAGEFASNNQANDVSCVSATNCVVTLGMIAKETRWNGVTWTTPVSQAGVRYSQQTGCTAGGKCLSAGADGDLSWFDGSAWGHLSLIGSRDGSNVVSCARGVEFCAWSAGDDNGRIGTWRAPTPIGTATTTTASGAGRDVMAIDCASDRLCVAAGSSGGIVRWDGSSWIAAPARAGL